MDEYGLNNNKDIEITENNSNEQALDIELSFLRNLAGWATFKAVIDIILGALACIGIITAVYGIPQIIAGIRLLNASDDLKRFIATNDTRRIGDVLYNFNKHFKLTGITIIIRIVLIVIVIILYIIFLVFFMSQIVDYLQDLPWNYFPYQ